MIVGGVDYEGLHRNGTTHHGNDVYLTTDGIHWSIQCSQCEFNQGASYRAYSGLVASLDGVTWWLAGGHYGYVDGSNAPTTTVFYSTNEGVTWSAAKEGAFQRADSLWGVLLMEDFYAGGLYMWGGLNDFNNKDCMGNLSRAEIDPSGYGTWALNPELIDYPGTASPLYSPYNCNYGGGYGIPWFNISAMAEPHTLSAGVPFRAIAVLTDNDASAYWWDRVDAVTVAV